MSVDATRLVWERSPYSGATLLVHLVIADVVNEGHRHEFWMSLTQLERRARVSRKSAISALQTMVEEGYLEIVKPGRATRTTVVYRFCASALSAPAASGVSSPASDV